MNEVVDQVANEVVERRFTRKEPMMAGEAKATNGERKNGSMRRVPVWVWFGVGVLLLVLGLVLRPKTAQARHPDPRPGITALGVESPAEWSNEPETADVYRMAAEIPEVLDGLYCYCDCHHNFGHRSLLDCFKSDHGGNCDVCMNEVRIAYRMHKEGKTLQQIRQVIDATYGQGG